MTQFSLNVARAFGRSSLTARFYYSMGKKLGQVTRNSGKKRKRNFDLWMYNGDLNNAMRAFVRTQGDSKSKYS